MEQSPKYIVITGPTISDTFSKQVQQLGYQLFHLPTITVSDIQVSLKNQKILQNISSLDWIIFTSKNGVNFFLKICNKLGTNSSILKTKKIAAVGPKTAEEIKKAGLAVSFTPNRFTGEDLAHQLPDIVGRKIILVRSQIGSSGLPEILKKRGAKLNDIPIYKTTLQKKRNLEFETLVLKNQIHSIVFTSPSTVNGLCKIIPKRKQKKLLSIPAICIGPITQKEANDFGFKIVYTASASTSEGLQKIIKQFK